MLPVERYMTARQAADALGVTPATLYAYISRGRLHSEPAPGRPRERRYYREDIERLRERRETRRDPAKAAARGLHWGSPALPSGITLIHEGKLYYRGREVSELARKAAVEEVAELLWDADPAQRGRLFSQPCPLSPGQLARLRDLSRDPVTRMQAALPLAGAADLAAYDLRPAAVRLAGARIFRLLTSILAGRDSRMPAHLALQAAWAPRRAAAGDVIRTVLAVCADHELNASTFTARCAASARASPYDVVAAAMAALKGQRHGGETNRVAALFAETGTPKKARAVVANRLRRGESIPGFGHPLYPAGDPRAALLMDLAGKSGNDPAWRLVQALRGAGSNLLHDLPNLDFGLAAIALTYRLPSYAPLALFALGRTVGWIAHAIEQYSSSELIRPRALYTGPLPPADTAEPAIKPSAAASRHPRRAPRRASIPRSNLRPTPPPAPA
ncbi:MAG TPA: citrate synthase family protein [Bryobacteraceae bacterium]|nr:citrate synthase family protein [Bryobacteraceae bacterium]